MKHCIIVLILFLFCCGTLNVFAQTKERPLWTTNGYFKEKKESYIKVISVQTSNKEDGLTKAIDRLLKEGDLRTGAKAVRDKDGKLKLVEGIAMIETARIIRDWYDGNGEYYFLVQVLKGPIPQYHYDPVLITNEYRFSPRVFVPGMAQLHKGSTAKGIAFIAGEIAMIGGYVIADNMESSNNNKAKSTHNAKQKKDYLDNANSCVTAKNICLAGAAIVYAWNVIDGIVAKGKEHVLFGDASLQMAPYSTFDGGGLALRLKF